MSVEFKPFCSVSKLLKLFGYEKEYPCFNQFIEPCIVCGGDADYFIVSYRFDQHFELEYDIVFYCLNCYCK